MVQTPIHILGMAVPNFLHIFRKYDLMVISNYNSWFLLNWINLNGELCSLLIYTHTHRHRTKTSTNIANITYWVLYWPTTTHPPPSICPCTVPVSVSWTYWFGADWQNTAKIMGCDFNGWLTGMWFSCFWQPWLPPRLHTVMKQAAVLQRPRRARRGGATSVSQLLENWCLQPNSLEAAPFSVEPSHEASALANTLITILWQTLK